MIGPRQTPDVQVWIATAPIDMRKSFDGLAEIVRTFLGQDLPVQNLVRTFFLSFARENKNLSLVSQ